MEQRSRDEQKAELEHAYQDRLGDLDNPNVALVVEDLMAQGGIMASLGAMHKTDGPLRAHAAAHDLVTRILNKAGLTREPRHLFKKARASKRAKTEGDDA